MLKKEENHEDNCVTAQMISGTSSYDVVVDGEEFHKTDQLIYSNIKKFTKFDKFRVLHSNATRTIDVTVNTSLPIL